MSELKVILATPHPKMKNACDGAVEVYLKSEADKVIAENDAEIAELKAQKAQAEDDCAYWKSKAQRERHNKYKRCLTMYHYCAIKALYELDFKGNDVEWKWYSKWMHKWFNLAEKFKEAK